jgi:hypothetical protein
MRTVVLAAALAVTATSGSTTSQQAPADWRLRTDAPATLQPIGEISPGTWQFVTMAPGWHITTGPGALLSPPSGTIRGHFRLEAEIFLFPGESQEGYGLFIGGAGVESTSRSPSYLAFLARRDGRAAIVRTTSIGSVPAVDWKINDAVLPHPGIGTAKNVLHVEVTPTEIVFGANGKEIARLPAAGLETAGAFGFRVGRDLNLHVSTLDVTQRLAPVPPKK